MQRSKREKAEFEALIARWYEACEEHDLGPILARAGESMLRGDEIWKGGGRSLSNTAGVSVEEKKRESHESFGPAASGRYFYRPNKQESETEPDFDSA